MGRKEAFLYLSLDFVPVRAIEATDFAYVEHMWPTDFRVGGSDVYKWKWVKFHMNMVVTLYGSI